MTAFNEAKKAQDYLAGFLEGRAHFLPVRVYFEDTDFSGVVYHASYLRWCERGRSDFLRLKGVHHNELASGGPSGAAAAFAVRRLSAEYLKPARIDDILVVRTEVSSVSKASLTLAQSIARDGRIIFEMTVQCVLVSADGRVLRLPQTLLDL